MSWEMLCQQCYAGDYALFNPPAHIMVFQASLNAGLDLQKAVKLPAGESLDEWLAVHSMYGRVP